MKYKVGDKVVVVSNRVKRMNPDGKMDKWLREIMTVDHVVGLYDPIYYMYEDGHFWHWYNNMIDHEATKKLRSADPTYEELAQEVGKLVDEKNKDYGDAINNTGEFLKQLYPDGIKPEQYEAVGVQVRVFDKLMRSANFDSEENWKDILGYALLMLMKYRR